jgi:hypothetical protein
MGKVLSFELLGGARAELPASPSPPQVRPRTHDCSKVVRIGLGSERFEVGVHLWCLIPGFGWGEFRVRAFFCKFTSPCMGGQIVCVDGQIVSVQLEKCVHKRQIVSVDDEVCPWTRKVW